MTNTNTETQTEDYILAVVTNQLKDLSHAIAYDVGNTYITNACREIISNIQRIADGHKE